MKKITLFLKLSFVLLFLSLSSNNADASINAQQNTTQGSTYNDKKINQKGSVLDESGQSIIGAAVIVKGGSNGTITDFDGNFTLDVPKGTTLVVSYLGYISQEVKTTGKNLKIILKEDSKALSEVVVVGFGTKKKVNVTGAVSAIDDKVFQSRPVSDVSQMLQGTVPGLNITQTGGTSMNSGTNINVRGITTIGQGSSGNPLVLIDGMEGDLSSINPQDIQNISVLKDATSSSIYGSRAPFGVILVTTKSGSKGKVSVNYSNNLKWSSPVSLPNMSTSYEYANQQKDAYNNAGKAAAVISDEEIAMIKARMEGETTYTMSDGTVMQLTPSYINYSSNPNRWGDGIGYGLDNVDYFDLCFRKNVFSQEHNLSVKGGTEKTNYYLSANYSDENGLFQYNQESLKRITTSAKISTKLTSWAKLNVTNRFTNKKFKEPTGVNTYGGFWKRFALWPNEPAYDANGHLFPGGPAYYLENSGTTETSKRWLYQQYQLELEPIKNWKTFIDYNYKRESTEATTIKSLNYEWSVDEKEKFLDTRDPNDYIEELRSSNNYTNINLYTQYSYDINEDNNMKVMLGFQSEEQDLGNVSVSRQGLIVDDASCLDLTNGISSSGTASMPDVSGNYYNWSTCGFFGRLNYDYKERYLAEFNIRYDGTSRFQSDSRWGWFPSASLGWNIAREAFFEDYLDYVSTLKLRASYGELGNQNTSSYYPTYSKVNIKTSGGNWLIDNSRPNVAGEPEMIDEDLTWETIKNWNFGLDLSAFNSRLTGSFDYYIRNTEDMVGPAPELPDVFGYSVPKQNNTDLRTKGMELMISWRDVLKNGLSYGITATLADSKTEITSYPNDTKSLSSYYSGMNMGEIWGYETIGLAKTNEEMESYLANVDQSKIGSQWAAGDVMYKDLNGDKEISNGSNTLGNHGDLKIIGNNLPRYQVGVTLNAAWKGFDVRAFFQGVLKRDYFFNATSSNGYSASTFWGACGSVWNHLGFASSLDYFRANEDAALGQNINSYLPRPLFNNYKNQQPQTRYLQDASYVRFKNLQIGYTIPKFLIENWKISKLRMFVSGENIATFCDLPQQYDPETLDLNAGGIAYPLSKTWSCGVNVTF